MDKLKIRISSFVFLIIENDAERFGFIKADDTPNKNSLINKLIPNLLEIRKIRREKIKFLLNRFGNSKTEDIYEAVNQVIDEVYFDNADLSVLDKEIWVLPTKNSELAFEEIINSELNITALTLTEYIRGLLNEYALLPQYKREAFIFFDEISIIEEACSKFYPLHFDMNGEKFLFFPFCHMYGFLFDQTNYVIGYDIKRKQIRSLPLAFLSKLYFVKKKYKPTSDLIDRLQNFLNEYDYNFEKILDLGEDYEGEEK